MSVRESFLINHAIQWDRDTDIGLYYIMTYEIILLFYLFYFIFANFYCYKINYL